MADIKIGDRIELVKVFGVTSIFTMGTKLKVVSVNEEDGAFEVLVGSAIGSRHSTLWMEKPNVKGITKPFGMNHEFKILGASNE